MSQSHKPQDHDLPSSSQLLKSTVIALAAAAVLIVCVVIPAEYGKDPTGAGALLGLKRMGEIKIRLEEEMLQNDHRNNETISLTEDDMNDERTSEEKRDATEFTLEPNAAIEIKLEMKKGSSASYKWETRNGGLNFNLHGDGYKGSAESVTYKKGRMTLADSGKIVSEFDGYHGWFWRNRNHEAVTVRLETDGEYIAVKQMK
jgi:hypothetical protein